MLGAKNRAIPIPLKNLRKAMTSMFEAAAQRSADTERVAIPMMHIFLAPNFAARTAPGTWKSPMPTRNAEEISPSPETSLWRSTAMRKKTGGIENQLME